MEMRVHGHAYDTVGVANFETPTGAVLRRDRASQKQNTTLNGSFGKVGLLPRGLANS